VTAELARQWRSRCYSIVACGGGEGTEKMSCEPVGQARGRFKSWPAVPGQPRRVAVRSGGRRRVSTMRHWFSETDQLL